MFFALRSRPAAGPLVLALALGGACASDPPLRLTDASGPPSLALLGPSAGACVEVLPGPEPRVPVQVQVQNLRLRPDGTCYGAEKCGHLELWVDGRLNNASNGSTIDFLLRSFGDREASFTVEVRVVDDDGAAVLGVAPDGTKDTPLVASVSFDARYSCTGAGGGGGGTSTTTGAGGATSSASSSSGGGATSTGTGGAGGATSTGTGGAGGATSTGTGGAGGATAVTAAAGGAGLLEALDR